MDLKNPSLNKAVQQAQQHVTPATREWWHARREHGAVPLGAAAH